MFARIIGPLWWTYSFIIEVFFSSVYSYSFERMLAIKTICFFLLLTAVVLEAAPKGISINSQSFERTFKTLAS